jgi:hypothetical protein
MHPARHLTLFVPGLLGPRTPFPEVITEDLTVPALEDLLSRARCCPAAWADDSLEGMLFSAFGVPRGEGDWPVAAVTWLADCKTPLPGWYLRADPIHLRADLTRLIAFDADTFCLSMPEANALAAEINDHFRTEGWQIQVPHPQRWYLCLSQAPRLRTYAPSLLAGQDLKSYLPEGEDGRRWRQWLNETQMVLHRSPVNREREARGELSVTSLWFWGGGSLPAPPFPRWQQVWAKDPVAKGLAQLSGTPYRDRPPTANDGFAEGLLPGAHLVVLEAGYRLSRGGNVEDWRAYISSLEREWFQPLRQALWRGVIRSLDVRTGSEQNFLLTPASRWRWWRRRRGGWTFPAPRRPVS